MSVHKKGTDAAHYIAASVHCLDYTTNDTFLSIKLGRNDSETVAMRKGDKI